MTRSVRGFFQALGSLWFAAVLLVLLLVAMACATAYETRYGTGRALAEFYHARWFVALLALFALNNLAALIARYPYSRKLAGFAITHASILVILVGALVSDRLAIDGQVSLAEGQTATTFIDRHQEVVTLTNSATGVQTTLALPPHIFGGFAAVETPGMPPVRVDDVVVVVERYTPDQRSVAEASADRDNRDQAVFIKVTAGGRTDTGWLQKYSAIRVVDAAQPYEIAYSDREVPLGFELKLREFRLGFYPGGRSPRSFESIVDLRDPGTGRVRGAVVTMNAPTTHGGYSLFQSSYDISGGQRRTVLSVSYDPGKPIVFSGYALLALGMIVVFVTRIAGRREMARAGGRP